MQKKPSSTSPIQLVLASFLMLFLELALIRWSGSNIVYLSYFTNFVLLGSFLGIGLGFLRARSRYDLFPLAPIALTTFIAFVFIAPAEISRYGSDLIYFGNFSRSGLPAWITLPVIFLAVATIMATVAEGVARRFVAFKPLEAYRLDIAGSIAGVVSFALLSFTNAPPVVWGAVVALLFGLLLQRKTRTALIVVPIVGMLLLLGAESLSPSTYWSPYYKIRLQNIKTADDSPFINIDVNGIPHQTIKSTTERRRTEPIYFLPYERLADKQLDDVLIVGAGNGSDVAIALSMGAKHIAAVEIDPRLYGFGKKLHPDHPYQDSRVKVYINDGRAFLESTDAKYDLILFALPDSLTLVSSQSSLRLESYLFTSEAMQAAASHLRGDGMFGMYNYYRERWLVDRLATTLEQTYGHPPCLDTVGRRTQLALLTISHSGSTNCPSTWSAATKDLGVATDNWPFLYLRTRGIPATYFVTVALILLTALAAVRFVAGPLRRQMASYLDLFFMGAAFFLLETKSVVQFALLFGTTWFVNALVILGVLLIIFAAIEVVRVVGDIRSQVRKVLWALLFLSLVVNLFVPTGALLQFSSGLRFTLAVALAFTPIFIANLIFAQRFKNVVSSPIAFGVNLLGALLGGVLEYGALILGYRSLTAVVIIFYGLAFITYSKQAVSPGRKKPS